MSKRFTIISHDILSGYMELHGLFEDFELALAICRAMAKRDGSGIEGMMEDIPGGTHHVDQNKKITWTWNVLEILKLTF